jgi:hypothetical protein
MKILDYILILILIVVIILLIKNNKKYNLAFYTCFYGSESNIAFKVPELPSEKYDCYYFTNNKKILSMIKGTKWIGIYDDKPVTEDIIESCMYGKYVKVLPNNTNLQKYDYTCFLDSKLKKISESMIENLINTYMVNTDKALLLREHTIIKDPNIWNEFNESMKQERYSTQRKQILNYINKKLESGFKETIDTHSQCGLLVRKMNHPKISEVNNTWYENIQECGIQDQISFFFVKQSYDKYIYSFNEDPFMK